MNITEAYNEEKRFLNLHRRREPFRIMCEHVVDFASREGGCTIIETGSAWHTGNWRGQGQSTLIWDWLCKLDPRVQALSIDIREEATKNAAAQTSKVRYITGDSVSVLAKMDHDVLQECGLLYLDSYDWSIETNIESAFHHAAELAAVWRYLPDGCMIAVDDRHGPSKGKHWMVEAFMEHYLKHKPVYKVHQVLWVKGQYA